MATFATAPVAKSADQTRTYLGQLVGVVKLLLGDKRYFWYLTVLAVLGDAVLIQLIIRFISFTEIDYETYMEQVACYEAGERSYTFLTGPSGPLVYPAGHLWIHRLLRYLTVDGKGINISLAQQIYAALYTVTLILTCQIYYEARSLPNYAIIPLVLSKRLHSIFVLRLFNDCWAITLMMASILAYQKRRFLLGSTLFSLALSVKMNILLYLPGLLVILVQSLGVVATVGHMLLIGLVQLAVAWPFLSTYPADYLHGAFDFSRQFLYTWTVNWKFFPESTFVSLGFARSLTLCHVITLVAFGYIWCQPDGGVLRVLDKAFRRPGSPAGGRPLTADRTSYMGHQSTLPSAYREHTILFEAAVGIATILLTSNLIGILFARSLHYQFYSWYAHQLPFLMWRTRYPPLLKIALLGAVEYSWNVFPSTKASSGVLLFFNLALILGIYLGYPNGRLEEVDKSA